METMMLDFTTADLHVHSSFSDGRYDLPLLLEKVAAAGITTLSVTDHDTLEGTRLAQSLARGYGIRHIPGVEISAHKGVEVHILAYGLDVDHRSLNDLLDAVRQDRRRRAFEIVDRLRAMDIPLSFDELEAAAAGASLGRPHIARLMVEKGFVGTMFEAFQQYLGDEGPAYVPKRYMPAEDVIRIVREAGGASVLAHPGCISDQNIVNQLIDDGIDGLEYIHPSHDGAATTYYYELAKAHRLLCTGGSDFHGHRGEEQRHLGKHVISGRRAALLLKHVDKLQNKTHHDPCQKS